MGDAGPTADLDRAFSAIERALARRGAGIDVREVGHVLGVGHGIATVRGLPDVGSEELVVFAGSRRGIAFDLAPERLGVVLLDEAGGIEAGGRVRRTGRVVDVPVGDALVGRVVDPVGRPLDGRGPIRAEDRLPIERPAPAIMDRAPVDTPLQTGIKAIDALVPIGRGQRELIVGDRQTGKTAIALDTMLNQRGRDVVCIYCAIGQRSASIARVVSDLGERGALDYALVVAATGEDPPGLQFAAPYAATTIGEFFMEQGRDVLVVYDDLTHHARAYREISLLLRRPPGREAYPGDIFYVHSRMLERATHLRAERGGGSLTALPVVETQEGNISAYIPTNLISITDGQIFLSPKLFRQGMLPAIDIGKSVSRVGGKAQLPAYREVVGDLRLAYAQFEELERFSRYGARLEEEMERSLEHGRRVREILKQPQYETLPVAEQIASLFAASEGLLDGLAAGDVAEAERAIRDESVDLLEDLAARIAEGEKLGDEDRERLREVARKVVGRLERDGDD